MKKDRFSELLEYPKLIALNLWTTHRNLVDFAKTAFRYYSNSAFMKVDCALITAYALKSPFRISKEFLQTKGEETVFAYGETPLATLETIADKCGISKKDTVFELGSGRGRACFWLRCLVGCKVVGIEFIPEFVLKAKQIQERFKIRDLEFRNEDMLEADLKGATVIYLYGTCMKDSDIRQLIDSFEKLPSGTKIITVSYSLADYMQRPFLEVMRVFPAEFTWGTGDVYLHYRR